MLRVAFTQVQVIWELWGAIEKGFELLLLIPHIVKLLPETNQPTVLEKSVGFDNGRIHIRLLLCFQFQIKNGRVAHYSSDRVEIC
jgi:hypothetical protein